MRELLVTITLLSLVSSEEFEPKKRLEIPPEEDPNFWPTRGRRSYWSNPRLTGNLIRQDFPQGPGVDYTRHPRSWSSENDFTPAPRVLGFSDGWKIHSCPRKNPISLVLPLQEYHPDDTDLLECGGRCDVPIRGRSRRGEHRWRRQQPLYVEEPGWIAINYDRGVLGGSVGTEDPFVVARGKKRNEEIFDIRDRRQLEDVLSAHSTDPFFVARGKRNINYGDVFSEGESERLSLEVKSANKLYSKLQRRRRRSSDSGDEKPSDSEESEVSSTENEKFFGKRPEDDKKPFLTSPGLEKDEDNGYHRLQRSSAEIFEGDDNGWTKTGAVPKGDEFSAVKSRYSRPRDKHSNLQSMLDEPFFVSRGKKNKNNDQDREPPIMIREYYRSNDEEEILKDFYRDSSALGVAYAAAFLNSPMPEDPGLFSKISNDDSKRSAPATRAKPPRNRRGMLDDLLKEDDPFYVARGKRIYPDSQLFDVTINDGGTANGKFSLFAKTSRTKLLKKLSDYSRIRKKPVYSKGSGKDFWNLTNNQIHDIY